MLQLTHKVRGQGQAIVLLHGLFGSASTLTGIARFLSSKYTVHSFDLPGHGQSASCADMSLPSLAASVLDNVQGLNIQSPHIIGHSLGGKVAMQLALNSPAAFSSVTVLDIAPVEYHGGLENVFEGLLSVDFNTAKSRGDVNTQLAKHIAEQGVRDFLMTNLRKADDAYEWRIDVDYLAACYSDFLAAPQSDGVFTKPALFVHGANSDYVLPAHTPLIENLFTDVQVKTVADTGHWLHAEKPDTVHALLNEFLSALA